MATQTGFGALLNELARGKSALAARIVTTSPDVTVSTNLGGWVNRRKLFARDTVADLFRKEKIPSTFVWDFSPQGQHIELGIAEMNLFILLSALGLSHTINGERLLPIGCQHMQCHARRQSLQPVEQRRVGLSRHAGAHIILDAFEKLIPRHAGRDRRKNFDKYGSAFQAQ